MGTFMNKITRLVKKFKHWMAYSPPGALSARGWRLFNREYKKNAPIRYLLNKTIKRKIINRIVNNIAHVKYWIIYRTTERSHVVKTELKPDYIELSKRMLYASFFLLKEHVEIDSAWHNHCVSGNLTFCEKYMPFYNILTKFKNPELGVAYFEWAATLDNPALPPHEQSPDQARSAREVLALYTWWTLLRPAREEATRTTYSYQGFELGSLDSSFDVNAPDYVSYMAAMDKINDMEEIWEQEDTDMLIRLIKIRKSLWV